MATIVANRVGFQGDPSVFAFRTTDPAAVTGSGIIYWKEVSAGERELFARDEDSGGDIVQITAGNALNAGAVDHGGLTGRGDDDHTQYALVVGRAGENLTVQGNLIVEGTTTTVDSETVLVSDNHLYINNGYVTDAAQTGGLVVNHDPTTTTDTVADAFVAGVPATSNPTVVTTGSATFSASDIVQISDSTSNDGLFEVLTHTGTTLTVRGIGLTAAVEDFTQNDFTAEAGTGAITKVSVSVLRAGTDGLWETAFGSSTGLTFSNIAFVGGAFHDGFSDFVANEHIDWTSASDNFSTTGYARIGTATDADAQGDFAAGLVSDARIFQDQSAGRLYLYGDAMTFPALDSDVTLAIGRASSASDHCEVSIISGNTGQAALNLGDTDDEDIVTLVYNNNSNILSLVVGGAERQRWTAAITSVNELGNDHDFKVAGDTLSRMLFLEGNAASENIAFLTTAVPDWQSMDRGMFIGDVSTVPDDNPTAGIFVWSLSGVGQARAGSGTVTDWAPAGPHCAKCGYDAWAVACHNDIWKSWHYECGNCGEVYKGGPKSILDILGEKERGEIIRKDMGWDEVSKKFFGAAA